MNDTNEAAGTPAAPTKSTAATRIEAIEAKRAARRAALAAAHEEQRGIDLDAIDALEDELGVSNVTVLATNYAPGLPALTLVRAPLGAELKRYQDSVRPSKKGELGNTSEAAEKLGRTCLAYPPKDSPLYAELIEKRPGMQAGWGLAALRLSEAQAEDEAKR